MKMIIYAWIFLSLLMCYTMDMVENWDYPASLCCAEIPSPKYLLILVVLDENDRFLVIHFFIPTYEIHITSTLTGMQEAPKFPQNIRLINYFRFDINSYFVTFFIRICFYQLSCLSSLCFYRDTLCELLVFMI